MTRPDTPPWADLLAALSEADDEPPPEPPPTPPLILTPEGWRPLQRRRRP